MFLRFFKEKQDVNVIRLKSKSVLKRYKVALMLFLACFIIYGQRACIKTSVRTQSYWQQKDRNCEDNYNESNITGEPTIKPIVQNWTDTQIKIVLHLAYMAAISAHIPIGFLCDRYGSKQFLTLGVFLTSVVTVITPIVITSGGWFLVGVLQIFFGWGLSMLYPGIACFLINWFPKSERTTMCAALLQAYGVCNNLGEMLSVKITYLAQNYVFCYYTQVGLGLFWCLFFSVVVYNTPDEHPNITIQEKLFLNANIVKKTDKITPIFKIITDLGVWATILANIASDQYIYLDIYVMPYMMDTFRKSHSTIEYAKLGNNVLVCVAGILFGRLQDYLITKKKFKTVCVRIASFVLGMTLTHLCLHLAIRIECRDFWLFLLYYITGHIFRSCYAGAGVADISYNHVGFLTGFIYDLNTAPAIILTIYKADVIDREFLQNSMNTIFFVTIFVMLFYTFFARAERAEWDYSQDELTNYVRTKETWSCFEKVQEIIE